MSLEFLKCFLLLIVDRAQDIRHCFKHYHVFSNIIMFQFGFHVWHRMLHGERNLWLDGQSGQSHSYITGCLKTFYMVSKAISRVSKNILQCVQKLFYSL